MRIKRALRIGLRITGLVVLALGIWQCKLVSYGITMGYNQLKIVNNAEPIETYLNDPDYPDSLKEKLQFVQVVRQYAVDSLGLNNSENYTEMYDMKGKPILWIVTASEPYELTPYEWWFPVVGRVGYKGHFSYEKVVKEAYKIKAKGYDVRISEVQGWSTLGWFKDPILSHMLNDSKGELANLIIHELTHSTIFVKNNVDFNENLATFFGDKGALKFLKDVYGDTSAEYKRYVHIKADRQKFAAYMLSGAKRLDSFYKTVSDSSEEVKDRLKAHKIREIVQGLQEVDFHNKELYHNLYKEHLPNNALFLHFRRYRAKQSQFEEEFEKEFDGRFKAYLAHWREKAPAN